MEEYDRLFDVCVVCAMYEEAQAVLAEFATRCQVSFTEAFSRRDRYAYRYTTIQNSRSEPLTILITWPSERGPVQTGMDLKPFLDEFRPRLAAMTGICAGDRTKVKLGDLIVAECAYLYEEGKVVAGSNGQTIQLLETKTVASTSQVIQYARGFEGWKALLREMKQTKLKRALKTNEEPKQHIAPMASGMAVRGDNPFPWLRQRYHRNTLGVDMEAASFYRAFGAFSHIHALVVKGVSDYGDHTKHDRYHEYAARASAIYLLRFIQEYVTNETMPPFEIRTGPSEVWNVPYLRNPHFTGRDELLMQLEQHLSSARQDTSTTTRRAALTQPQAIKGLGGIGKTQIAVEYAYRSREQGRYAHILWVNAASEEVLLTNFVELAEQLPAFPARNETNQRQLVEAIKGWLEQCKQRWLLIFDNADDLSLVSEYLPKLGNGGILLTTRANAVGALALSVEVGTMGFIEGTDLLLRRAQRFGQASDEEINQAGNIVVALDHFPLALDQAGAYIEETQCSFVDYLTIYQDHRKALLARRGTQATNYPDSVATTWSLSFRKVEQANPAAAELLRLCAFLAPDRIPEELITNGTARWSPLLQQATSDPFLFDQALAELLKFSLVKRLVEDQMLSVHRLIQAVQIDAMEQKTQRQWAEQVVQAVNDVFPRDSQDITVWPQCLRYLGQAQACDLLIRQYLLLHPVAADLLNRVGLYTEKCGLYALAEPLYEQALAIREQQLGPLHSDTATSLLNLAFLSKSQGKYPQVEPLLLRALSVCEQQLGPLHPKTATCLAYLAVLYRNQGRYAEAEPLTLRALSIQEQLLGPLHPDTTARVADLAYLYRCQGRYAEAEPLYEQALATREQLLGPQHPETATCLVDLGALYRDQSKYARAEPLLLRALSIQEQQLGPLHPKTAICLVNLATLYRSQGKYKEAELLLHRALKIREQVLGSTHPDTAHSLHALALLSRTQGKDEQAEEFFLRALAIREHILDPNHPDLAKTLHEFAILRQAQGQYDEARSLYERALVARTKTLGPAHPYTIETREHLTALLHSMD